MRNPDETFDLVVDVATKRPGCVLLQAGYGCNSSLVSELFDTDDWVLAPTAEMAVVNGTYEQWKGHAAKLRSKRSVK